MFQELLSVTTDDDDAVSFHTVASFNFLFYIEYTQLRGCFVVFIRQVTTSDDSREKQMVCIMYLLV